MTRHTYLPSRRTRGGVIAAVVVVLAIGGGVLWTRDHPESNPGASIALPRPIEQRTAQIGPGPSAEQESGWVPDGPAPPGPRSEARSSPAPRPSSPAERPHRTPVSPPARLAPLPTAAAELPGQAAADRVRGSEGAGAVPPARSIGPAGSATDAVVTGDADASTRGESAAGGEATPRHSTAPPSPGGEAPASAPTRAPAPAAKPPAPVLTPPVPIVLDPPRHPDAWRIVVEGPGLAAGARPAGAAARVRLRALVREDGAVGEVTIAASSGRADLDAAAADAARGWRFRPAQRDGVAITSTVLIWVVFMMVP